LTVHSNVNFLFQINKIYPKMREMLIKDLCYYNTYFLIGGGTIDTFICLNILYNCILFLPLLSIFLVGLIMILYKIREESEIDYCFHVY
jgi:hypothetical protein